MKKPQIILLIIALAAVAGLYFFGSTVPSAKKNETAVAAAAADSSHQHFSIEKFNQSVIAGLSDQRQQYLATLENVGKNNQRPTDRENAIHAYHQIAAFWEDSIYNPPLHYYHLSQAAELENSEKSLTFAAHSILGYLPFAQNQEEQSWLASVGKELFEKALIINPANDSSVVGAGGCIMYGADAGPQGTMQGIIKVREVAEKDSTNMFAQYMLGVGGVMSRQYDKAVIRFEKVATAQPKNLEVLFKLAEVNELMNNNSKAVYWYQQILPLVKEPGIRTEIEKRIENLKHS